MIFDKVENHQHIWGPIINMDTAYRSSTRNEAEVGKSSQFGFTAYFKHKEGDLSNMFEEFVNSEQPSTIETFLSLDQAESVDQENQPHSVGKINDKIDSLDKLFSKVQQELKVVIPDPIKQEFIEKHKHSTHFDYIEKMLLERLCEHIEATIRTIHIKFKSLWKVVPSKKIVLLLKKPVYFDGKFFTEYYGDIPRIEILYRFDNKNKCFIKEKSSESICRLQVTESPISKDDIYIIGNWKLIVLVVDESIEIEASSENFSFTTVCNNQKFSIGSRFDNVICLDDQSVGTVHAEVYKGDNEWMIKDLNTGNGTWKLVHSNRTLNYKESDHVEIKDQQIISVNSLNYRFIDISPI